MTMLKKISVLLCASLFATAFAAGCKKDSGSGGGGCDAVASKMKSEMMSHNLPPDAPADMKKQMGEMAGKMADIGAKRCKEDKWSADVIKCIQNAKDAKSECEGKLSAEQQK